MNALWKILPLLLLMGCSADMAMQSIEQSDVTNASVQTQFAEQQEVPVTDIEPSDPDCITHNTGFVQLRNPYGVAVTCRIGEQHTFVISPGATVVEIIPVGAFEIQWWAGCQGHYADEVMVSRCATTNAQFEQAKALKYRAIQ